MSTRPGTAGAPDRLDASLVLVLTSCLAVRLALFMWAPQLVEALQTRPELNDPFNSWSSLCKAQWSLRPPMNAHITKARPAPFVIMLLGSVIPSGDRTTSTFALGSFPLFTSVIEPSAVAFALIDTLSAFFLFRTTLVRLRTPIVPEETTPKRIPHRLQARHLLQSLGTLGLRLDPHPLNVTALFAFNPLTIATCLARSGTTLVSCLMLMAVWAASSGYSAALGCAVAGAGLTALHPFLLAPSLILLCARQKRYLRNYGGRRIGRERKPDKFKDWTSPLTWSVLFTAGFAWLSAGFIAETEGRGEVEPRDWLVLAEIYKTFLILPSLKPSLSLWWYFFIEIFEHFRDFFLLVFNAHVALWTGPVTIRFRHDPLFATFLLLGVQAIFKPYPTAGDVATWWSLSLIFSGDYAPYLRNPMPPILIYFYATLLVPLFSHLFLTLGSANANFLYAVSLVWSLGGISMWLDWAWAGGRAGWEREREAGFVQDGNGADERSTKQDGAVKARKLRAVVQV